MFERFLDSLKGHQIGDGFFSGVLQYSVCLSSSASLAPTARLSCFLFFNLKKA